MKRCFICFLAVVLLITGCGCGSGEEIKAFVYEEGMYQDVREWDFYRDAVEFSVNNGYMAYEGDTFGIDEPVTRGECAELVVKILNVETDNPIEYVVENAIVPYDFGEWDIPVIRCEAAYMFSRIADHVYINPVIEGSVSDIADTREKDEIYALYKMGIFSGDKTANTFRPNDMLTRAEAAIIIYRMCNAPERMRFDMGRLSVSFVAFGDTIAHGPVTAAGKEQEGYNFTELFENVKVYIDQADVACVNQETVFVERNFTGYPSFGGPVEMGIAEAEAGFDVVTHATNHAFDRGESGLLYTTQFWENYPSVTMLGIHQDAADAQIIEVIEKDGIKIALLNYTYSLNGYRLPSGKGYMVDLLDREKIISDMARADEISDAIVVFAHWGNEYQNTPCKSQEDWAQLFADCGATVVVGHHPHVVQPLRYVTANDGRTVPVYYSLGNFISNQNDYQTALCAMADFEIVKDEKGVRCENAVIEPVITHMESGYYSAYLLKDYPDEMLMRHKHRGRYGQRFTKEKYQEVFDGIVN